MSRFKQIFLERREEGMALVIAIVLLTAMELLGFALSTLSDIEYSVTGNVVKSEEALRAAEQGVMIAMDYIKNNPDQVSGAGPFTRCSQWYRNKNLYSACSALQGEAYINCAALNYPTCGQDSKPNWSVQIIKKGQWGGTGGLVPQPAGAQNYLYRIESTGQGSGGISREIVVEMLSSQEGSWELRQQSGEVDRKLAATLAGR
jgi:Tfp pilus assembly protein PilX